MLPLTILAGYLGAGKTTRITRLLCQPNGERVGILVNDFGSINIDQALIAERGGKTVSLSNGCVCCTIADDLGGALDIMLSQSQHLDRLVLEASGAADPSRLRGYAETWPGLKSMGVVTVADVRRVRRLSDDKYVGSTVRRQLRAADQIILSHTDVAPQEVDPLMEWLATQTTAPVCCGDQIGDRWLAGKACDSQSLRLNVSELPAQHYTTTVVSQVPLEASRVDNLIRCPPNWLLRAKGWLYRDDRPQTRYLLQGVPGDWSLTPDSSLGEKATQTTIVAVWVDPDLDSDAVRRLFAASEHNTDVVARPSKRP